MKILIIDDENLQITLLTEMLNEYPEVEEIYTANQAKEGLDMVKDIKPDVIFLDVSMPSMTGIEVAEQITQLLKTPPIIIFTTSFEQYAIKAFELDALDYLVKPYSQERLYKALDKARVRMSQSNKKNTINRKIPVHERDSIILLDIEDIYYIETIRKKTVIYTKNKGYETRETLSSFEEKLNQDFIRCHKSYLVNYKKISKIEPMFNRTYVIKFEDVDYKVSVSRKYGKELLELLGIQ